MTRAPRRVTVRRWWLPAWTMIWAALAVTATPAQTNRTQERDLFVSVLNSAGDPVTGLDAGQFVIREDGLAREVLRARRATDPIDLAILVDNSQASEPAMLDLRRGLDAFVTRMHGQGHLTLVTLADRPTIALDYTNDLAALQKAVGRVFPVPGSGTTALQAIGEVVKGLKKRDAERAAILTIWLGGPEFSNEAHLNLIRDLKEDAAALHVLTLGPGVPADFMTPEGRDREIVFDQGARDTGGRRQNVLSAMGLPDALSKLADELTNQYRITYARPDSLIPPEKFEVSVRTPGHTARGTRVRTPKKGPAGS